MTEIDIPDKREDGSSRITPYEAGKKGLYCTYLEGVMRITLLLPNEISPTIEDSLVDEYISGLKEFLGEHDYKTVFPAHPPEDLVRYCVLEGFIAGRTLQKPTREFPSGLDFKKLGEEKFNAQYSRASLYKAGYTLGFWVMAMADCGVNLTSDEIPRRESTYYAFMSAVTESNLDDNIAHQTGLKLRDARTHKFSAEFVSSQSK